ncbi:MAG: DUF4386 domain-containing protein [Caldilineaceae bacterium]
MTTIKQTLTNQPRTDTPVPAQRSTAKRVVNPSQRRAEIMIASLFLLTAAASIVGGSLLDPKLESHDYLAWIFPNKGAVQLDALLISINNIGIVFIAVFAFPLLRKLDEALAASYLATRIVECTLMMVGIVAILLLIPLSQAFLAAGATQNPSLVAIGDRLKDLKSLAQFQVAMPLLGLGGCFFTWTLFRFRLLPRWLAGFGLFSYALVFLAGIGSWFDLVSFSLMGGSGILAGSGMLLSLPVAFWEIILMPFWLFFRGFATVEPRLT